MRILNTARNNYLLALAAINALQKLYDQDNLPQLIEKVDGFFYDILASVINKYTDLETTLSNEINTCMEKIRNDSDLISRDVDLEQFLNQYSSIFKPSTIFSFENVGQDERKELVVDDFSKVDLGRKLGELIVQDTLLVSLQETKEKELIGAEQLVEINTSVIPQTNNATSLLELRQDIQNTLSVIKCQRTKLIHQMKIIKALNGWNLM